MKIRRGMFETNSSSTHSFTTGFHASTMATRNDFYTTGDGNTVIIYEQGFGWGPDKFTDCNIKLAYVYHALRYVEASRDFSFDDIIRELGFSGYEIRNTDEGYIDHQSHGLFSSEFTTVSSIVEFICNNDSRLIIDHDNH